MANEKFLAQKGFFSSSTFVALSPNPPARVVNSSIKAIAMDKLQVGRLFAVRPSLSFALGVDSWA